MLLISEDLDEVRALSDRIAVIYEGQIIGVVNRDQATIEQLGLMMAGVPMHEALGTGGARRGQARGGEQQPMLPPLRSPRPECPTSLHLGRRRAV